MSQRPHLSDMSDDEFNVYVISVNAAMSHYHTHYNNDIYQSVQISVVKDLYGHQQADDPVLLDGALSEVPAHTLMNLVIDVALEICGHPDMVGRHQQLLVVLMHQPISDVTISSMIIHWRSFEREGSVFTADFEKTVRAARQLHTLLEGLKDISQMITDIHGQAGNTAYHLVRACQGLMRAAELILWAEPSAAYINEQIQSAARHIADSQKLIGQLLASDQLLAKSAVQLFQTLLLSADGTYPGLVISITDRIAQITWYKWGYEGETFNDWMVLANIADFILSAPECQKRFGGLPPEYQG